MYINNNYLKSFNVQIMPNLPGTINTPEIN